MAEGEEEVNYASVVFKAGNNPPPAEKRGEETVYGEVKGAERNKERGLSRASALSALGLLLGDSLCPSAGRHHRSLRLP
ncbi:hypothetical protein CesoFtcFv8_012170 [Champsocephalus esox]|uniref:Uncharacterized protein n=1 Tax=Champsocephalus esox TaxID=159716 RepID=A0AAN8BTV5_9TELE|nr:hypothetical protein CesoFtcFv8_012170 [Champsocephalus esox]